MSLPVNKIETLETLDSKVQKFYSFSDHIREKYGISYEYMKILDCLTLEEMLALKLEKSLRVFNGKVLFPVKSILELSFTKALYRLLDAYPSKEDQRMIQNLLIFSRKAKVKLSRTFQKVMKNSKYDLEK